MSEKFFSTLTILRRKQVEARTGLSRSITLEVLATMRNPASVAFVKQANIGQAVQVNNGTQPQTMHVPQPTRACENLNPTNELLEVKDGERLDTRTTGTTSSFDTHMESMEQVNRAANCER